jgi:hypothetical protein
LTGENSELLSGTLGLDDALVKQELPKLRLVPSGERIVLKTSSENDQIKHEHNVHLHVHERFLGTSVLIGRPRVGFVPVALYQILRASLSVVWA